ncbi:MAG: contact-dependent growth inhibition system immunity protein [Pyrinomonadaceae bacterium]
MNNYRYKFAGLFQFFGGYFYQGWTSDYNWETAKPDFSAVVRHFKAVNPPKTVISVKNELEDLLSLDLDEEDLTAVLTELGSNFHAPAENLTNKQWLENILAVLRESPTTARVLREIK